MNWDTIQQIIRIVTYPISGWLVAKGWPEDMAMTLLGAVTGIGSVLWWYLWDRKRKAETVPEFVGENV